MGTPFDLIWIAVPLDVVLQGVALARPRNRVVAVLPLAVVVPGAAHAAVLRAQESHLWPLALLFVAPAAVLYLAALLLTPTITPDPPTRAHQP
ncbi:MAG: hypothetical protein U0804_04220 [Gemmataceae bacterium]